MYSTSDFRRGLKIEWEGAPYEIVDFLHVKPGKGGAFIRTKLKNMLTGRVLENTFRSGEKVEKPDIAVTEMQFLYREGNDLVFMDMVSYEQIHVDAETLSSAGGYLLDGQELKVLTYKGKVIDVDLPTSVVIEVVQTEPGLKGDTVSGSTKPATLSTGLVVNVPLFIDIGDRIKVDTRSGEYLGREK